MSGLTYSLCPLQTDCSQHPCDQFPPSPPQLKIRDVHVRYEEPGFAAGLTVGALTAQSCDERWVPGFVSECRDNMRFKLLELQQLDVYWDTQAQMYSDMAIGQLAVSSARRELFVLVVTT